MSRAFSLSHGDGACLATVRVHGMNTTFPQRSRTGRERRSQCEAEPENGRHARDGPIRDRRDACPRNTRESQGMRQDAAFRKDAPEAGVVAREGDGAAEDGATRSGGRRKAASHE